MVLRRTLDSMHWLAALALLAASVRCAPRAKSDKPQVAASFFPIWDIGRRVAGDRVDVIRVLPRGRSEHYYDPAPRELLRFVDARLGFTVGLHLDPWAEKIIHAAAGDDVPIVQLGPHVKTRAITGGEMLGSEDADRSAAHTTEHAAEEYSHHGATDPHFWMDPTLMQTVADVYADELSLLDPAGADGFHARAARVKAELTQLDETIMAHSRAWTEHRIVTFHGSFGYFAARYGLTIAAVIEPFPGREPTPQYVAHVLHELKERHVRVLFTEPQLPQRPAEVIAQMSGTLLRTVDPVGGQHEGDTYESMMEHNLDVLDEVLR
jgi:ABC-type Zn uptake system ZnuABC Zn-binding protein ZnuA